MSVKEADRYAVIRQVIARTMGQSDAALWLGVSVRQVKRLTRALRIEGAAGIVSKHRGAPSNRRIAQCERDKFVGIVHQHYADFGHQIQTLNGDRPLSDRQWAEAKASVKDMVLRGIGAI